MHSRSMKRMCLPVNLSNTAVQRVSRCSFRLCVRAAHLASGNRAYAETNVVNAADGHGTGTLRLDHFGLYMARIVSSMIGINGFATTRSSTYRGSKRAVIAHIS